MGKVVHRSHITITREHGPTRKAEIQGFGEPVFYGVHGGIKDFYKIFPDDKPREIKKVINKMVETGELEFWSSGSTTMYGLKGVGIQHSSEGEE